jgi:dTDP-glucose 4,6-dehydratase
MTETKTCLVTGGAGFLGSHLCDYLLEKGYKVLCLDNLITGSTRNIEHFLGNERFKFYKYDVSEYLFVEEPVDFIFHFASPASPRDYLEYPIQTLKVGALGTHKTLGLAKAKKATYVLASTSEVYGDPLIHPQSEDYWGNVNPVGPRGVYDEAKRFAEALAMAYYRAHGVNVKIARIFNTFGPRMRLKDGRVVPNFISQALQNDPMTVYGEGKQTRSFCYVLDLVRGIYSLAMSSLHEPVNLGNPQEMTVLEFAHLIKKMLNSTSSITFEDLPQDDPHVRQPNIEKAKKHLGWSPQVSLEEGLQKTVQYFKNELVRLEK